MPSAEATGSVSGPTEAAGYVYVYGVCRSGGGVDDVADGIGGSGVDLVVHRHLAAIVSDVPEPRVRATRRDLMRHSNVLAGVFERGQVLPLRFGTIYPSRDAVAQSLLAARYDELDELLASLDAKVELSVKAFYDERAILTEVVNADPRIARMREATRSQPAAASHALRLELGQAVAHALEERRAVDAEEILARVRPFADAIVVDDQQVENLVVKAALLVDRAEIATVDDVMDKLAREEAGRMHFKYVGPLPPHTFVAIESPEPA
jgi:Gas vesicle synthesis protein GvpL/GvpF